MISGVTVELLWDATTDVSCLKLDGDVDMDYSDVPESARLQIIPLQARLATCC